MAIFSRPGGASSGDIINGQATVSVGGLGHLYYDPRDRDQHVVEPSGLAQFDRLNHAYHYHGGTSGSGNWEH